MQTLDTENDILKSDVEHLDNFTIVENIYIIHEDKLLSALIAN